MTESIADAFKCNQCGAEYASEKEFGGPDVLVIDELPIPSPRDGESLVRVAAAGLGP